MEMAPFGCAESEQQGAVDSGMSYYVGANRINRETHAMLEVTGGALVAGIDDAYQVGPPEEAFRILQDHKQCLCEVGLVLNILKTKCFIKEEFRSA